MTFFILFFFPLNALFTTIEILLYIILYLSYFLEKYIKFLLIKYCYLTTDGAIKVFLHWLQVDRNGARGYIGQLDKRIYISSIPVPRYFVTESLWDHSW